MTAPAAQGDSNPAAWLSVDRIFGAAKEFRPETWGPAHWLKGGQAFTTLELSAAFKDHPQAAEIKDIVSVDPATGSRTVIVAARELLPSGATRPLEIEKYAWSEDTTTLLVFTNAQKVWREKTRGDYWVLHRPTGSLRQLGAPPRRRRCSSPRCRRMAPASPMCTRTTSTCSRWPTSASPR